MIQEELSWRVAVVRNEQSLGFGLANMRGVAPLYEAADDLLQTGSRSLAWVR